jgi:gas vesicle protein
MFPLGFVLGAVAGAAGAFFLGPQFAQNARPLAKAVLKAALGAIHEAQVRTAEVAEAAEDLVSEAKAELVAEAVASATAQTKAESTGLATKTNEANGSPAKKGSARAGAKTARRRMAVKRSHALSTTRG